MTREKIAFPRENELTGTFGDNNSKASLDVTDFSGKLLFSAPQTENRDVFLIWDRDNSNYPMPVYNVFRINKPIFLKVDKLSMTAGVNLRNLEERFLQFYDANPDQNVADGDLRAIVMAPETVMYNQEQRSGRLRLLEGTTALSQVINICPPTEMFMVFGYDEFPEETLIHNLKNNDYMVTDADPKIVFHPDPKKKWRMAVDKVMPDMGHYYVPNVLTTTPSGHEFMKILDQIALQN